MVSHDLALALPLAPGTLGNTNELGWQAGLAELLQDHPLPDSPFPCRRRRCRPSWGCIPRKASSEPDRS